MNTEAEQHSIVSYGRLTATRIAAGFVFVVTLALSAYFTGPLNPDVSGQFWLARAMRRGSHLYTDLIEINPPLWFWMAIPIDWLAQTLGVRSQPITIAIIGMIVLAVVFASARLIRQLEFKAAVGLLIYVAALLLIMPMQHLEQREHLVLIGSVPYLLVAAARRRREAVPASVAILIGLGAGLGFALKPFFLAVPVLIELWLVVACRRQWRPLRPETIALATTGGIYGAAVVIFTPEYLTITVPLLLSFYEAAAPPLLQSMDFLPFIWVCMLAGVSVNRRTIIAGNAPITVAFLLGFVGFAFAYAIQHKGWLYQGLPATGCLAIALAASLIEGCWPSNRARLFIPALLIWPLAFPIVDTEMTIGPYNVSVPHSANFGTATRSD